MEALDMLRLLDSVLIIMIWV